MAKPVYIDPKLHKVLMKHVKRDLGMTMQSFITRMVKDYLEKENVIGNTKGNKA